MMLEEIYIVKYPYILAKMTIKVMLNQLQRQDTIALLALLRGHWRLTGVFFRKSVDFEINSLEVQMSK